MKAGLFFSRLKSGAILNYYKRRYKRHIVLSENHVFEIQEKLLKEQLELAKSSCEYYKKYGADNALNNLNDFPIVDKSIISNNWEDFINRNKDSFIWFDSYTGGSTGEPFHLLNVENYESEFGRRKWKIFGYQKGNTILALDGTKVDEPLLDKHIYWKKKSDKDIPFGSYALSSLYLTDENAIDYCKYICEFSPNFIRGYPAFVYSIACYAEKLGIAFPKMKGIELTSETALPYQIEKIKRIFNTQVYLQYGHTEACVFGYTKDDTYKYCVEPLYGVVEVLGENDEHVKENEVGEVVVTSLHNPVMPLIRYRTGDYAEYGGEDQRYVYLNKVLGRTQDYIFDKAGNKVLLTALIFGQHFHAMGKIVKWQLEQCQIGTVLAHIIKGNDYAKEDETEIQNLFNDVGNVNIIFDYVKDIPLTSRGKSKMLIQHMEQ